MLHKVVACGFKLHERFIFQWFLTVFYNAISWQFVTFGFSG